MSLLHDVWVWFKTHWPEILTIGGTTTGGLAVGKKWVDKEQDKKIQQLEDRVDAHDGKLDEISKDQQKIRNDLEINTRFDKKHHEEIRDRFNRVENKQDQLDQKADKILDKIFEIVNK